ncbi:filamentous hemagglutinin family protein [Pseudomonas granadensis]|uniref:filamentous haemagglutinin family protein n=1 Tax=Pseudomonas granadensis TaxID=1421430 RepID=UPI0019D2935B|nr:filamentous haemagglutinin family protein [Pseudomonas granadensis]MBN6776059.1 filamentous hemagglutinin family protein [Pseudomonas granadensis]MBN6807077.1 filamentous hemagglutinin family protein [Pseudomonas granadensis]MBN6834075.1 filamentous hemagglutinin family protein [Pseudomonas granadensis]MBN6841452.1 filamentous hemagglutinin family protein [Pseudomonas granadensis]MBN6870263.1 filamentous hemagglutinin family protein [Pseudomonas granadensis]
MLARPSRRRSNVQSSRREIVEPALWLLKPLAQAVALCLVAGGAQAQTAFNSAWFAAKGAAQQAAAARPGGGGLPGMTPPLAQQQKANQQLQRSIQTLNNTVAAIAAQQAAQAAGRAAVLGSVQVVPDGLGEGGLKVDNSLAQGWQNAKGPQQTQSSGKTTVKIEQTADKAILNWETFNVGRNTTVEFAQQSNWAVLNRVNDPSARPSQIQGQIKGDGTVMLINRNGIVFSGSSQVNVRNLVAAAANITDIQFRDRGLYFDSTGTQPTFTEAAGKVLVERGAAIETHKPVASTDAGGYALLLGHEVQNDGSISTVKGQTVLAAGDRFYIRKGSGTEGNALSTTFGSEVIPGFKAGAAAGKVINSGLIQSATGDITLTGHDVVQNGVLLASTSVATRGTIHLSNPSTDATGSVTLGQGSATAVLLDSSDLTALDSQHDAALTGVNANNRIRGDQSRIEVQSGGTVEFQNGSITLATGGQVAVSAQRRSLVRDDAMIDVSGALGVKVAMENNSIKINMQGNEQRDASGNRDKGALNSNDIWVDVRELVYVPAGTNGYATDRWYTAGGLLEVGGYLGTQGHSVGEWMAQGGTVSFAGNDVVTENGSLINLSGGTLDVQSGEVRQSWLRGEDGKLYEVSRAPGDLLYTGLYKGYEDHSERWGQTSVFYNPLIAPRSRFESGYTVGRDAGQLVIATANALLAGQLVGEVYQGERQNQAPKPQLDGYDQGQTALARRAQLIVGSYEPTYVAAAGGLLYTLNPTLDKVQIGGEGPIGGSDLDLTGAVADARKGTLFLDNDQLNGFHLGALKVAARDQVVVDGALTVDNGGDITLYAPDVQIGADLTVRGGSLRLGNVLNQFLSSGTTDTRLTAKDGKPTQVTVTEGVRLDVRGLWSNLRTNPDDGASLAYLNGGLLSIRSSGDIDIGAGSLLDVSSGGAILANGKTRGGKGGDLTLESSAISAPGQTHLKLEGDLRGYGVTGGGTLTVQANKILVGQTDKALADHTLQVSADLFNKGFSAYNLIGLSGLQIAEDAAIDVSMPVYRFTEQALNLASAADPRAALELWTPPLFQQDPLKGVLTQRGGASLTLQGGASLIGLIDAANSSLTLDRGSRISVDPGQRIMLRGAGQITVDGELNAWGGTIDIRQQQFGSINPSTSTQQADPKAHERSIWIGAQAVLDVAGRASTAIDAMGRTYGQVGKGGSIIVGGEIDATTATATAADAYVIVRQGARLDASGSEAVLAIAGQGPTRVASDGGRISLSSYNGLFIDGDLRAAAGGLGASGGRLELALETPLYVDSASNAVRTPREMIIGQSAGDKALAVDLQPGEAADGLRYGQTRLSADSLMAGGFDNLSLFSNGLLSFDGDVALQMKQSLNLYAGALSLAEDSKATTRVELSAPYLRLSGVGSYFAGVGLMRPRLLLNPTTKLADATFSASANLLDLRNGLSFGTQGSIAQLQAPAVEYSRRAFGRVSLNSSGDLRFLAPNDGAPKTRLWTPGDLDLGAAQIYPATGVQAEVRVGYQGDIATSSHTLRISGRGPAPAAVPYSVFGSLSLAAGSIVQGGVIRAPLGLITVGDDVVTKTREVRLLPGSVTSVSGAGLVMPYGGTTDGIDYRYDGKSVVLNGVTGDTDGVVLNSQFIDVQSGALIDLSGGGDLRGVGFVSGRGGSTDARFNPLVRNAGDGSFSLPGLASNPVYAIVPGNQSVYAPMLAEAGAVDPRIGQQITLGAGVPGLAAGTYTLLPSTFALLPGAFRVEVNGQATAGAMTSALPLRNGSWAGSGQLSIANTGVRDSLASQVILTSADVLRRYSQYNETGFTQFIQSDAARRGVSRALAPMDGKTLDVRLSAGSAQDIALQFNGQALFKAAEGGFTGTAAIRGGNAGADIEVLGTGRAPTEGFAGVSLYADSLNNLNAARLTLGALPKVVYNTSPNLIEFTGTSNNIVLREGAILAAPEVILRTTSTLGGITVEAGAGINTLGHGKVAYDSTAGYLYQPRNSSLLLASNGWTNVLAPEVASGITGAGSIRIGTCATDLCSAPAVLYSTGSITAATDNQFELSDAVRFGTRHLALSVGAVNAGSAEALAAAGNRVPAGLTLNQNVLDRLLRGDTQAGAPALETLSLTTRDAFNFFGSVSLDTLDPQTGQSKLQNLVLVTPAIYGLGDASDVASIRTANLIWNGAAQSPGAVITDGAGTGSGTLDIQAQRIELGYGPMPQASGLDQNNRLALGFANVNLTASERITANHKGSLAVYQEQGAYDPVKGYTYSGGNLNLRTPLLTGEAASVNLLKAGNNLTLNGGGAAGVADALGAELNLEARSIVLDSRITLASGKLTVKSEEDLNLGSGAVLDLAGRTLPFNDVNKYSWGGDVSLFSANGNIRQAAGSRIDLSAKNNQAGHLSAIALADAAGTVDLQGQILGGSSGYYDAGGTLVPYKAGGVEIRAQRLGGDATEQFAALNQRLNAGQVFGSRSLQLKQGDLLIGDGIKASEVNVSLDNGNLTVAGLVDASGERVGSIRLSAKNGLTLTGNSVLDAHGRVLRVDSYGEIIDAPNRATVELNSGEGALTLASGARIDLRHGTDAVPGNLAGQNDGMLRGTLELNAPRLGSNDIAIDASGALTIQGARSIGLNGTRRYTDARDGVDEAVSGRPYQVIDQAMLDRIHTDSDTFINAALNNTDLLQRKLAGLNNATYADAFHLRPGVEIASKTADGDLVVEGDLDLSGYRYASLNRHTQLNPSVYGSGEAGSLVIRAGGNLDLYGSINDGFAPPPETVDDAGWKLIAGVQPFGGDLIVPGSGVSLAEGTQFPIGATLNYDVTIQGAVLASGTLLPTQAVLAEAYTFSAGTVLAGAIHDPSGNLLYAAGTLLSESVTLPAQTRLGAGIRLNKATALQAMNWPKGVPLPGVYDADLLSVSGVKLSGSLALLRGSLIPSMTDVKLAEGTSLIELRPFTGEQQGKNWAVASMLPSGSASWSMRVVAGADLDAADSRTVKPLTGEGNLRLADSHYGVKVTTEAGKLVWAAGNPYGFPEFEPVSEEYLVLCDIEPGDCAPMARWVWAPGSGMGADYEPVPEEYYVICDLQPELCIGNNPGKTAKAHTQMFSVLRTGTGDLDLMAAGNLSMDSPFGVYTAGTQSANIDPLYNQPRGHLSDSNSVLGSAGADYEKWVNGGTDSLYQAWYPQLGGNLTLNAGGSVSGDSVGTKASSSNGGFREQMASAAVGNWLWRQGTGDAGMPAAWWINFGSYGSQLISTGSNNTEPYLVGFTGFGTLGGGNISLRAGADVGMLKPLGDAINYPRGQEVILAVGSTGRVGSDGSVQMTGGGDMDIRIGGVLNPSLQARASETGIGKPTHDLQGALINLRGAAQLNGGALGGINLQYGALAQVNDSRETRPFDPFTATVGSASGGLVLIPGDSAMQLNSRGDLVLGGATDPGRVRLTNASPVYDDTGSVTQGGVLSGFSLWTEHTAIDLFSAGGNLTPSTQVGEFSVSGNLVTGRNTSATDGRFVYPSILRAVAGQGSIYAGPSATFTNLQNPLTAYSLLLAPSPAGQLELLAGDSIYAGGYAINQSGASPSAIATPFNPAFNAFATNTSTKPQRSNYSRDGVLPETNTRYPLFAFGPDSYSGLNDVPGPARFYALTGDLVGIRSGETLNFALSKRTWYEAAGPVWMIAGRDIVASGTNLGQPTAVQPEEMGVDQENITSTGNLFVHNDPRDVSRVSAGRDILYSSFDIAGPGTLDINAGRNILMEDRASITSLGSLVAGDKRPGASVVLQAGIGAQGPDYSRFIARYLDPQNLANPDASLSAQPGKVVKSYVGELQSWLTLGYGFSGNAEQAQAFYAALPSAEQAIFARQVYFAELRAGGLEYNDADGPRQGSYLRGRNAIAALFPTTDVAGNAIRYDGDITLYGGAGVKTLFGGDIQMLTPGGGQVFGIEGAAPPSTAGIITQGSGNIQLYSQGSILLGQSRIMTTFGGSILGWSAEGDINAGRGSKTTVVYTPPKRVYDNWGNVTLSPSVPSTGAGIATLNPIAEVAPGDIDLIAPLGTIDAGEAGIRVSGNVNIAALTVVNAANISVQGKATGVPVVSAVNTGAITSASSAASSATQAAEDVARQQQAAARQNQASVFTVQVLSFGNEQLTPSRDGASRAPAPGYNPNSPVQVLGAGALDEQARQQLTEEERGQLTL